MADVKNIVSLGIGASPGNIRYFVLVGLDINPVVIPIPLTLLPRSAGLTLDNRDTALAIEPRPTSLTIKDIR